MLLPWCGRFCYFLFWLCWVFIASCRLSLVAESRGLQFGCSVQASHCYGAQASGTWILEAQHAGYAAAAHRLRGCGESESKVLVAQACPTLCNPRGYSPPGSSVHGILQEKILEWVAIPFSRGSSLLRDQTRSPALQADSLLFEPAEKLSVVVVHRLSCSAACEIFPDQELNPCPLHWQVDSHPLYHQGSPILLFSRKNSFTPLPPYACLPCWFGAWLCDLHWHTEFGKRNCVPFLSSVSALLLRSCLLVREEPTPGSCCSSSPSSGKTWSTPDPIKHLGAQPVGSREKPAKAQSSHRTMNEKPMFGAVGNHGD